MGRPCWVLAGMKADAEGELPWGGERGESSSARCEGAQARSESASSSDFPRDVVRLQSGPEGKCRQGEMPLHTHSP